MPEIKEFSVVGIQGNYRGYIVIIERGNPLIDHRLHFIRLHSKQAPSQEIYQIVYTIENPAPIAARATCSRTPDAPCGCQAHGVLDKRR